MAAQRHNKVEVLSDQEAWELFREAAGECVENEDIQDIAKEVAKECGGLPIAVVTLGKALTKREKHEWEDTLLQLKKSSGMQDRVQSSIMLSYNFLESRHPNAQPLLLLCCLFQEDENIPIEQLVHYSMGLKFFEDVETLEETKNRVYSLVNKLKSCNLLLQGDQDGNDLCVKLHCIVRDVCLLIASNPQNTYLVRHNVKLKQWPQQNQQKTYTAIALTSDAMNELPSGLEYPNLSLLQLKLKNVSISIPKEFFQKMRGVRVFNFHARRESYHNDTRSNVLMPPTLELLTNLQMLSLEFCNLGGDISIIGCLKGLKILSFLGSRVDRFPNEVGELKNLKLLDLRCHSSNFKIGKLLLSGLSQLEVLYMGEFTSWEDENGASITELNSLSSLTTLQICVSDELVLLKLEESFFVNLKRFDVWIGCQGYSCGKHGISRNSIVHACDDMKWLSHTKLQPLLRKTQHFGVQGCEEDQFIFGTYSDSENNVFLNLESLEIEEMSNLTEIYLENKTRDASFRKLREVRLAELPELKHLWRGPIQPPSLGNLRILEMNTCHSIQSLFSPNVAICLVQLEKLDIICCSELKGVISNQGGVEKIQFPKLKYVGLEKLENFISFYPKSDHEESIGDCDSLQSLFNQWVIFPSLEKIELQEMESLKQIVSNKMEDGPGSNLRSMVVLFCEKIKTFVDSVTLQNLEEVEISDCESMEAVFDFEGFKVMGEDPPYIFDKLANINLINLDNLEHVWRKVPDGIHGFRNLTSLAVTYCTMRYLLPYSIAKMLVTLQSLKVEFCDEIVSVIQLGEEEECVVFPELQVLVLYNLHSFTSFCSIKCSFEFPKLREVKITTCPEMEFFCNGDVKAPILSEPVDADPRNKHWVWEGDLNNGTYRGTREMKEEDESVNQ